MATERARVRQHLHYFRSPKPLKYFLFVLRSRGAPSTHPINPASRRISRVVCSLGFVEKYSSSASRTTSDSRAPVARERSFSRRAIPPGTRTEIR